MNSDEGEGSDDNSKDYSKVSNYEFNFEKESYKSSSKYDYKAKRSTAHSDTAGIDSNASYHLNLPPVLMSNDKVFGVQNAKCVSTEKSLKDLGQSEEIDEHEALSSMMSFFTYCHKVESEKEANC